MSEAVLGSVEVKAHEAVGNLTLKVTVTGMTAMRARSWLGIQLLKLAAFVIGCQLEVSLDGDEPMHIPALAIPPAKLSMGDIESGRFPYDDARRILVMLDGVEAKQVTAYNCEAGWVERYRRDARGRIVSNGEGAEAEIERLHGTVTAEYRTKA